ncbi:MAG: ethylbenzene dehydrogenase-related protein [Nitrospirota bacterium]
MKRNSILVMLAIGLSFVFLLLLNAHASEPDWDKIKNTKITLFYPGQASYEFLVSPAHPGAKAVAGNEMNCIICHKGKEPDLAKNILARREPTPIARKEPTKELSVKSAYDDEYIYLRFQWKAKEACFHRAYQVFDGKEWKKQGGIDRPYNESKGVPAQYEERLSIMIDDGKNPDFGKRGCFITCHNDMRKMPNAPKESEVKAHPVLGDAGMKKKDIRKYISASRTNMDSTGGWANIKSKEEIEKLKWQGLFLDLLQWRAMRSNPLGFLDDGYVLEYRLFDKDGKFMEGNFDKDKKQPKYMFDEKKVGMKAFPYDQIKKQKYYYISKDIAVPFDPNAGWEKGDAVPDPIIFFPQDNTSSAKGVWKDGQWTVVIKRKLNHGNPKEDKILKPGNIYTVGFAIHDDNTTQRHHYVSFPLTMGFDSPQTDINVVKTK